MMKCFINEKNNKIKSILKGVGEIPRLFSENMLERVYINEHTRKSDERTDRYRRQYTGFISSRFGKTFVLTYRIAYLITEMFVEPSSIVALTFTNKAAAQMKHRLRDIVGDIVRHKVFGVGEIIKIDNITQTYEIQFRNIRGTRRIMFRAELEKVSQPD